VSVVGFAPFRVDLADERVWKGDTEVALRRKPFAILRYLLANPSRLVTHDELIAHVWGGSVISESAMRSHVYELRQVLGEVAIETVIGRGYRFVAPLTAPAPTPAPARMPSATGVDAVLAGPRSSPLHDAADRWAPEAPPDRAIVGRRAELEVLAGALARALAGQRQVCFVTGDPGIGKTALADTFLAEVDPRRALALRGHCIEQYGTPEAYDAVIEVLGQLRRTPHGAAAAALLVRYAPGFLAQVPHLVPDEHRADVLRRAGPAPETRIARELIEALEAIAEHHPLVIVLDDLQWSDVATIDLVALLAQRKERCRLLVIATARRGDVGLASHPLNRVMRTLIARGAATAVPLAGIEHDEVAGYLARRFPGHAFPAELVDTLDRITIGTPLFVVSFVDDLVARGMIAERGGAWTLTAPLADVADHRPESVSQLIAIQLDRLAPAEQRALEAASVVGAEFSTALVAAALEQPELDVDELCDGLARRGLFLRPAGTEVWPDGGVHTRYRVHHALVQEACLERAAPARRQRWHRLVADALERGYGDRAGEVSHALATHFEQGQHPAAAMRYYAIAGERTAQRYSHHDANRLFRRGVALLTRQPETPERDAIELRLLEGLSHSTVLSGDGERHEPIARFERMIVLARRLGDAPTLYAALVHLHFRLITLSEFARARALEAELDARAATTAITPALHQYAEFARALREMYTGELEAAIPRMEQLAGGPAVGGLLGVLGSADRVAMIRTFLSTARFVHGDLDQAVAAAQGAIDQAARSGDPYTRGAGVMALARVRMWRGESDGVAGAIDRVLAIPEADVWHIQGRLIAAGARAAAAPLPDAERAELVAAWRARTGPFKMGATVLGLSLLEALRRSGDAARAGAIIDELIEFARAHDEVLLYPELVRQRGELCEAEDPARAAACYVEAIEHARPRALRLLELRAATRLARLVARRDLTDAGVDRATGRAHLAAALAPLTEAGDARDLVDARAALAAL
jgi:DNA-binding winged helix-turn-helix (wHTH) protein/tetratricopeptide (TPR) repeat protein